MTSVNLDELLNGAIEIAQIELQPRLQGLSSSTTQKDLLNVSSSVTSTINSTASSTANPTAIPIVNSTTVPTVISPSQPKSPINPFHVNSEPISSLCVRFGLYTIPTKVVNIPFEGKSPFDVLIDNSAQLKNLVQIANQIVDFNFGTKREIIVGLVRSSMQNAFETGDTDIVSTTHPLSVALTRQVGCCRYMTVLFHVLAEAANFGSVRKLRYTQIRAGLCTTFNHIEDNGTVDVISPFLCSTKDVTKTYLNTVPFDVVKQFSKIYDDCCWM